MRQHIANRHGHFAGEAILAGQFADLEEPQNALVLDVGRALGDLVSDVVVQLELA
jgi:gluconate kinase